MALFDFLKKKKEEPAEEEKGPWELAYQAQPKAYESDEGEPLIVFTLTEGTDTILPMDPKRMYKIGKREINDFRLGFCSLKEDRIIATLPFYACINALAPYVIDVREPFVLIRAMSHEELTELCDHVTADIQNRGHLQKAFEKNLEFIGLDHTEKETVRRVFHSDRAETFVFDNVRFPSGTVTVCDPMSQLPDRDDPRWLDESIPAGTYPLTLAIVHLPYDSVRIAGMKLQAGGPEAEEYRSLDTWYMKNGMKKDGMPGFGVEAGLACIADEAAAEAYWNFLDQWNRDNPGKNLYNDYFAELFQKSYEEHPDLQREGGDFLRWQIPGSEEEIVMCASGYGDGYYSVFGGYDSDGKLSEIVTMFIDPDLFEGEDHE